LQRVGLGPLLRAQNRRVDLRFEVFLLHEELRYGRTLLCGDLLHLAFIEIALRGGLVH
jgi:hypothetical protein